MLAFCRKRLSLGPQPKAGDRNRGTICTGVHVVAGERTGPNPALSCSALAYTAARTLLFHRVRTERVSATVGWLYTPPAPQPVP